MADLDEFQQAHDEGLILPGEADGARRGLAEFTAIIDRGGLAGVPFPARTPPGR